MLPPAREHNFYKTRIFDFIAKMGSKILVFQAQIPLKIEENRRQKRSFQTRPFVTPFLFIFDCILASKLRSKKNIFFDNFPAWPQEAPKRLQEHPKRPQEGSNTGFYEILAFILASIFGVFSCFFLMFLGFRSCMCPVSCASLLSLPLRLGGDIPRQLQSSAWVTSIRRISQI